MVHTIRCTNVQLTGRTRTSESYICGYYVCCIPVQNMSNHPPVLKQTNKLHLEMITPGAIRMIHHPDLIWSSQNTSSRDVVLIRTITRILLCSCPARPGSATCTSRVWSISVLSHRPRWATQQCDVSGSWARTASLATSSPIALWWGRARRHQVRLLQWALAVAARDFYRQNNMPVRRGRPRLSCRRITRRFVSVAPLLRVIKSHLCAGGSARSDGSRTRHRRW